MYLPVKFAKVLFIVECNKIVMYVTEHSKRKLQLVVLLVNIIITKAPMKLPIYLHINKNPDINFKEKLR